jgi:hypothetical protein
MSNDTDEWYSDRAASREAALEVTHPEGRARWTDLMVIWETRMQPSNDERCHNCGSDAREGAGGDGHFCGLHVGRDCPADCQRPEAHA